MRLLLSNDDGYQAPGLRLLADFLGKTHDIQVVCPDRDRSGASNSLTLDSPLRVSRAENGFLYVNGTPTDCVHLAITGLLDYIPEMVVSGINAGANLGDDVLYSGTVAAAMEGRFLGKPAIAVSLVGERHRHFKTAALVVERLILALPNFESGTRLLLNVNVPDVAYEDLRGFSITRLGYRHKSESVICAKDARGKDIYWIGPAGAEQDAGIGTDFYAVKQNKVSITPLQIDMTKYKVLYQLNDFLKDVFFV